MDNLIFTMRNKMDSPRTTSFIYSVVHREEERERKNIELISFYLPGCRLICPQT